MNQSPQHHEGRPHDDLRGGGSKTTTGCEDLRHFDWGREDDIPTAEVVSFSIDPACAFDRAEDRTRDEAMTSEEYDEDDDDDDEPMSFEPLPFRSDEGEDRTSPSAFGFARANYMDGIRSWSLGVLGADRREDDAPSPPPSLGLPPPPPRGFSAFPAALASSMEAAVRDRAGLSHARDHNHARDSPPPCPGAVRCGEDSSSSSSEASEDDCLSTGSSSSSNGMNGLPSSSPPPRGVTFDERVRVLPIPPLSSYTVDQRRRMFSGRLELRENKIRNKREYEFDGCDWRNATEEGFMAICPLSGELLHPAHL